MDYGGKVVFEPSGEPFSCGPSDSISRQAFTPNIADSRSWQIERPEFVQTCRRRDRKTGWRLAIDAAEPSAEVRGRRRNCQSAFNPDPRLEWAPGVGQFHAADLTGVRDCSSSKRLGLRYPSAECRRLSL